MHFTIVKAINLPHYLYRSLVKMTEKVQRKGKDHKSNQFHHGLVKFIVLHQLSEINLPWETFIQSAYLLPATSQRSDHTTPLASQKPLEVRSSNKLVA